MEAAEPILSATPKPNFKEMKMIDINNFDIYLNEVKYEFQFGKSENNGYIIFKVINKDNYFNSLYFLELNVNEFKNINSIFFLYNNIDEIFNFLLDIIKNNNYTSKTEDKKFIFAFHIPMPGGKIIDIIFELNEIKLREEDLAKEINSIIKNIIKENEIMKKEISTIKNELKNKNNELENLKSINIFLIDENNQIKKRLKNIEDYIYPKKNDSFFNITNKKFFDFDKSNIIRNVQEKNKLIEWISEKGKINNIKIIYNSKKDGDSAKDFHNKCAYKGPTISLIKSKKGKIFGGFTKCEWINERKIIYDNNAFLFSLDQLQKYEILKPEYALCCDPESEFYLIYGNNWDGCGIYLYSGGNKLVCKATENHKSRVYDVSSYYCLSGENHFDVEEIEVYQIIF